MLQILTKLELTAILHNCSVWLSVDAITAEYLNLCCTGQKDGGPGTAREVAATLGSLLDQAPVLEPPPDPATYGEPQQRSHNLNCRQEEQQVQLQPIDEPTTFTDGVKLQVCFAAATRHSTACSVNHVCAWYVPRCIAPHM